MSEATIELDDVDIDVEDEAPSEYTSETPNRPVITREIVKAPGGHDHNAQQGAGYVIQAPRLAANGQR